MYLDLKNIGGDKLFLIPDVSRILVHPNSACAMSADKRLGYFPNDREGVIANA